MCVWGGGGFNFTPLLVWTGGVSVCVGTLGRATHAGFSECTHARTHARANKERAQECVRKEQLMPREWSVRLMDGSYTAVMTYFDVACRSRPPFQTCEQKPLEKCNASIFKESFHEQMWEQRDGITSPLISREAQFRVFFFLFTFSNLLFKARSMRGKICPSAARQTGPLVDT